MEPARTHHITSEDGVRIVGQVVGQGPPLVLLHGAMADGQIEWQELLPHLTDRFTCYVPDLRGRGASDDHPDHSRAARLRDAIAFVESLEEPVAVMGVSGGGMLALGVTAESASVRAAVVHEPVVFEAMEETELDGYRRLIEEVERQHEGGDAVAAARAFFAWIANDDEMAAFGGDIEALTEVSRYVPVDIAEFREAAEGPGESPTDPRLLRRIDVPVLILHGERTGHPWFTRSAEVAAAQIDGAEIHELDGLGHLAALLGPERVAGEALPFFEEVLEPA